MQIDRDDMVQRILRSAGQVARAMRRMPLEGADHAPFWVLLALVDGGLRATELAQRMHLDVSTVSRHLDVLVAHGFVERRPDPADGRARQVVLTDAGRDHLRRLKAARRGLIVDQLNRWDDADLAALATLISRLADDVASTATLSEGNPA